MSTTFTVMVGDNHVDVARRTGIGNGKVRVIWLNELAPLLKDSTPVQAKDDSHQGVYYMEDLRNLEKEQ